MEIPHPKFVILLLCACGAVNILFYSINSEYMTKLDKRGAFVDLNSNRGHAALFNSTRALKTNTVTGSNKNQRFVNMNKQHSLSRKLNNAGPTETIEMQEVTGIMENNENSRLFNFLINPFDRCGDSTNNTNSLVVVVISRIDNFLRRNAIRNTWGSVVVGISGTLVFLVGTSREYNIQPQVEKESKLYSDMIQVDVLDTYTNLSLKSIAMLQWISDYCRNSDFYLKADDDVYVNIENVLKSLKLRTEKEFFLCHVFKRAPPIRDPQSKWFVSRDHYSKKYFPTYCSGTSYAFSSAVVSKVYMSALKVEFCIMEDVFITGLSAENKNIVHVHNGGFAYIKRKSTGCEYAHALTGHEVTIKDMYIIFAQITNHEIDCDTNENLVLKKAETEI